MSDEQQEIALEFIQRKIKNLEYFKTYRPQIYNHFHDYEPAHCEVVITPGTGDVDLVDRGHSFYKGLAKEYSYGEAQDFVRENANGKAVHFFEPPWFTRKTSSRFGKNFVRKSSKGSTLTPETFEGYDYDGVFPSLIFLGCGLGYHIEKVVETADVINAIIFEPDPDRFALSLFTVDWEEICKKFRRQGRSIEFSIASRPDDMDHLKRVLTGAVAGLIPLYPYFTVFYNHLVSVELFQLSQEVEKDLPVLAVNWADYDTQLFPYRNSYHNIKFSSQVFDPRGEEEAPYPVVIVGSGPSLDGRIEALKQFRSKVIIVSAGTSLKALLGHGVRPDYHVEVDPSNIIPAMHAETEQEYGLHDIVLVHCTTVNPLVPRLFEKAVPFLNASDYIPAVLGLWHLATPGASATCTNAALAVSYLCGARSIFLFGTDYGFVDTEQTHSLRSLYGEKSASDAEGGVRNRVSTINGTIFETDGVNGKRIFTRPDYYTAKKVVEHFIQDVQRAGVTLNIHNCSDGAEINGAEWLSFEGFCSSIGRFDELGAGPKDFFESRCLDLPDVKLEQRYEAVALEMKAMCCDLYRILRRARVSTKVDLMVAANEIRSCLHRVGGGSGRSAEESVQMMSWSVLHGTIQQFLRVGMCHGLAQDTASFQAFVGQWRAAFMEFLEQVPGHFERVTCRTSSVEDDPWVNSWVADDESFDEV